jgi:beta-galactosidase
VSYLGDVAAEAGVGGLVGRYPGKNNDLVAMLRLARRGDLLWANNYGWEAQSPPVVDGEIIIGKEGDVPAAGVVVWKLK